MSTIRLLLHGEVRDFEGHAAYAKRARSFVEAYEPQTLVWECFGDESSGSVVWHEVYANPDAYLFHMRNMEEQGFFDEFVRLTRLTKVVSLHLVTDDRVWSRLQTFNAEFLHGVELMVR